MPWSRIVLALGSGGLLNLAFPPHPAWWLAPVAVALLIAVVPRPGATDRGAAGLLHGLGFFVPLLVWTGTTAGPLAWLALAAAGGGVPRAPGLGAGCRQPGCAAGRCGPPLIWVAEEALRDRLPVRRLPLGPARLQPGTHPAHAAGRRRRARPGDPRRRGHRRPVAGVAAAAPALAALLLAPALVLLPCPGRRHTVGEPHRSRSCRATSRGWACRCADQQRAVLDNHVQATHELAADVRAGLRATARPGHLAGERLRRRPVHRRAAARSASTTPSATSASPCWSARSPTGPGDKVSNRGIVWDPVTGAGQSYVKRHPVPFGEYIPFRSLVRHVTSRVDLVPERLRAAAAPSVPCSVGPVLVGDVICFEVAYDGIVRDAVTAGGRLLVVQTNNATFGRSGETTQQLAMGRLRAVEHGRIVGGRRHQRGLRRHRPGRRARAPARRSSRATSRSQQVALRDGTTLATRLGWWPELRAVAARPGRALERGTPVSIGSVLVIVPTYNERENLELIAGRLHAAVPEAHLLVVDDNSPDGTGKIADELAECQRLGARPAPPGQAGPRRRLPRRLRLGPRARLRRRRRDGRRRLARARSSCPGCWPRWRTPTWCWAAAGSTGGADRQLAQEPRAAQPRRQRLHPDRARHAASRTPPAATGPTGGRARTQVLDAPGESAAIAAQGYCFQVDLAWQLWKAGQARGRGADHLRRARARRVQDEPGHRRSRRCGGSPAGACGTGSRRGRG